MSNWEIKPIIKFNSGMGAILCNQCGATLKSGLTKEEIKGKTDLLFCDDKCRNEYYIVNWPVI